MTSYVFCNQCGHRNPPDSGFCSSCGGVLDRIADERRVAVLVKLLGRQISMVVDAESVAGA